jgi:hypothetical protein
MVAGQTLVVTNEASDPDLPPQTLTFDLLQAPNGAVLDSSTGVLVWTSTLADADSTNLVAIQVADDGTPSLSATQSFHIMARMPLEPMVSQPVAGGGWLTFTVDGDPGVDYALWDSTNLLDWSLDFVTNPPVVPFPLMVPLEPSIPRRFYRVQIQ